MSDDPRVPAPNAEDDVAKPAASTWDGPLTFVAIVVVLAVATYVKYF